VASVGGGRRGCACGREFGRRLRRRRGSCRLSCRYVADMVGAVLCRGGRVSFSICVTQRFQSLVSMQGYERVNYRSQAILAQAYVRAISSSGFKLFALLRDWARREEASSMSWGGRSEVRPGSRE
jgi:hypothetical protein